jgi:hypothetical protein
MRGEASIVIDAPADVLYDMVSDVTRMGEWSPETTACKWIGASGAREGARFSGRNRARGSTWTMAATVTAAVPAEEFAFVTSKSEGPATHWSYRFEPVAGSTRVTERFEWKWKPSGTGFRAQVGAQPLGEAQRMVAERQRHLIASMETTLANLKRAAEGT